MIKLAAGFNEKIAKVGKSSYTADNLLVTVGKAQLSLITLMMALFYSRVSVRHTVVTVIQHAQCLKLKQRHSFYYLHLHLSYCDMSKCLLWKRLAWPVGIVGLCTYGQVHNEISRTKSGVCAALWFWQWKECVWLCISVLWVHIKSMYCISISDFFASGPWGLKATLNSRQAASKLDVSWPTHRRFSLYDPLWNS